MWTKTYKVVGFLEPGIVRFGDKNLTVYISKKTIERYSYRLKGKPVTIGHIEGITEANAQQYSVGDVAVCTDPGDCVVTIKNEEAERKIESGERFSCCWIPVKWGSGGVWHNIPYDKELVEMDFTHLAIVPDPRYENVEVFMNSKEYNNGDRLETGLSPEGKREMRATMRRNDSPSNALHSRISARSGGMSQEENKFRLKAAYDKQPSSFFSSCTKTKRKVSDFKNSLNPGQYAFLKKYIKEYNNAKVDEGLSVGQKREARIQRNTDIYEAGTKPKNTVNGRINYRQSVRDFMPKGLHPQQNKILLQRQYNNEAEPPDDSLERMSKINAYLQKRENRKIDKQYQTQEAPKRFADRYSEHFAGYKNCSYRRKDGKEFNNNVFKEALKKWTGNSRGESRIDNTRSLLTEQTGKMPTISKGPKGAVGRISESKAKRIAEDL